MALVRNKQVSSAEPEVNASLDRELLVLLLQVQQLRVVEREQEGSYVAVLHVLFLFVLREHYAGVPSELPSLMRPHK